MDRSNLDSPVMLTMTIPSSGNRSISPMSPVPSPSRELRGVRLFRAISRKLGRKHVQDYTCEDDSRSSSTDSCSSTSNTSATRCSRSKKPATEGSCSSGGSGFRSASPNHISSSGSDSGSDSQSSKRQRHHHSITGASFRKVFQSLTINSRSQSCSTTETKRRAAKKAAPKRILRPPVTYTYVRGLSGLPTQRIPRATRTFIGQNGCTCSGPYVPGLNR